MKLKVKMFDFSNYSVKSKYYDNPNKLAVGEMKDEMSGVAIEEFVEFKPKMYSFFVYDSSEHKKAKDKNKNVVTTISHSQCSCVQCISTSYLQKKKKKKKKHKIGNN